ncbi:hypothetical protein CLAFUW4_13453 [Fulvia fulva]|uniref:2EXR domain-containing protein n=1 Tax=Passalora fulva TaxID=5499 RepID=A0A9Q8PJ09_PASFU|nr:uncharacterized protein CLAFUR5_13307 [Fulvia fulva]KAK4612299.1 hypothetical protein CLAFUR4_13456 [Fulvia fulva]KAK4612451.1 hypothetical protein CLAFUR0_13464 [Fulvia fulva]UJO23358.1 hypothetical protein CLAFUR5_13307 [Fulvia fulva]WPV20936.1 hypothetical protein CLAFUW4_13453 [Fulvia fulva]WPV36609.1 hypothetical protein CLAFUW7_13460 [Fulvia fulva]
MSPRKQQTHKKPSPLLSLPAELRNHIWQLLLVAPCPIKLALEDDAGRITARIQNYHEASPSPSLLAVNKQIHNEATAYLHSDDTFTFAHDPRALWAFTKGIKKSARLVRHIDIAAPIALRQAAPVFAALQALTGLVTLEMSYNPRVAQSPRVMADNLLQWARASVRHQGKRVEEVIGGLRFYHVGYLSRPGGRQKVPSLGSKEEDPSDLRAAEEYTRDVKVQLVRLVRAGGK